MGLFTRSATLLTLFIATTLSLALLSVQTAAQEAPLTEASSFISTSKQTNSNQRHYRTGAKCLEQTFVLRKAGWGLKYKFRRLIPWYYSKEEVKVACATKTKYGVFGTSGSKDYLQMSGQTVAGEIVGHSFRQRIALPNSNSMLVSGDYFKTLYKIDDVATTAIRTVTSDRKITYTLAPPGPKIICTNKNACRLDTIGHQASSPSGKYIVAHIPDFGMTSMNVQTLEYQTFGRASVYKRTGAPPYRKMAVSSGGNYAAVYYSDIEKLFVYDLRNCKPNPDDPIKPDICASNDISQYLDGEGINLDKLQSLSFASEGNLYLLSNSTEAGKYSKTEVASSEGELIGEISYIALGDSFASGEGDLDADWYEVGTDEPENKCHLSRRSYPYLLAQNLNLDESHSVACSGAVISDVIDNPQTNKKAPGNTLGAWFPGVLKQEDYVNRLSPTAITISAGGNDVGFADKLTECVLDAGTCKYAEGWLGRSGTAIEIANQKKNLVDMYKQLAITTDGNTKIYAVGYPKFVNGDPAASCSLNVLLNSSEREFVEQGVMYMNSIIRSAAKEAGVYYLDIEDSLEGRNLCSSSPDYLTAVNGLTKGNDKFGVIGLESYHPNPIGHELIYESIQELTNNNLTTFEICASGVLVCPEESKVPLPGANYWGPEAVSYVESLNSPSFSVAEVRIPTKKIFTELVSEKGQQVDINTSDLKASSTVTVEIRSEPTTLGQFEVGSDGVLNAKIEIPEGMMPGLHTLHIIGKDTFGDPIDYYQHIYVTGPAEDVDGDGVLNGEDPCLYVEASNVDYDEDGIDDACDGFIGEKPSIVANTPIEDEIVSQVTSGASTNLNEAVTQTLLTTPSSQSAFNTLTNAVNAPQALGVSDAKNSEPTEDSSTNNREYTAQQTQFSNPDNLLLKSVGFLVILTSLVFVWRGLRKLIQR
ncbi:putative secreted hydrolase [hydrothermal vent metagenome]|uniref:Putative secreted hydrolase n=1 Tax=hydrothermal vent metagenome TaxID=652676 RepID=A0A3B0V757_9ZZZZ